MCQVMSFAPRSTPSIPAAVVAVDPATSFDGLYGLELLESDEDGTIRGRVAIRDELRQPAGVLHGGVLAAVAEALASYGTWNGVGGDDVTVMGMSNDTSFLAPFVEGSVHAAATPRHRGRTRWLWDVEFRDDDGRLRAVARVNIAVRARRRDAE
jgi:uncharacterized protein (TIGR00369 family)